MSRRVVLHLGWAAVATGAILLEVIIPASTNPDDWVWPLGLMPFPLAASLILIQRPGNRVGRVLLAIGAAAGFSFLGGWMAMTWFDAWWSPYLELLVSASVVVTFWGMVALLYVFPTGETLPGWPRLTLRWVTVMTLIVMPLFLLIRPGSLDVSAGIDRLPLRDNPLGVGPVWIVGLVSALFAVVVVGGVVGVVVLVTRFRRSTGVERAQIKVFIAGALFLIALFAVISSPLTGVGMTVSDALLGVVVIAGFWALPTAIVAAVLRYRLFEIDRLMSRTVTYLLVVGVLGLAYAGLVVGLRELFPVEGDLPVAVSTLVVALAFLPLVRRVQRVVDRRFFRSRYDASVVVARVAEELRGSLDLEDVTARAETVVSEVFSPESVTVWLAE